MTGSIHFMTLSLSAAGLAAHPESLDHIGREYQGMARSERHPIGTKRSGRRRHKLRSDPISEIASLSAEALHETEEAISRRRGLTQRFLREIEKEIAEALRMLRLLGDPWKRGDRTDYEVMRISLDKALTARKKERRARLLEEWKDLLALTEKRLVLLRENLALDSASSLGRKPNQETR